MKPKSYYTAIADAVNVGEGYEAAFTRLSSLEVAPEQSHRDLDGQEVRVWAAGQAAPAGDSEVELLWAKAKGGTATMLEDMAYNELNNGGLKTSDAAVRAMIMQVLPTTGGELVAMAVNPNVPQFPGLKPGEVQNAIEWRAEGRV